MPPKRRCGDDERVAARNAIKESLSKAEAAATRFLEKGLCKISEDDVLEALRALGGVWPTQERPNVAPDIKMPHVPGMCLGLAPDRSYAGCAVGKITKSCPNLSKLVTAWVANSLPDKDFRFGAVQINFNYRARKHIDANNLGPSYITSLGDHTGGHLWTGDRGVLDCKGSWKLFDGNTLHATQPFQGGEHVQCI